MRAFATLVVLVMAAVLLQTALPDRAVWHEGWYSVALAFALLIIALQARASRAILVAVGAGIIGFTGIASGLLAPDPQSVAGAPGSVVAVAELGGSLLFPPLGSRTPPQLERAGHASLAIGGQRYTNAFVLHAVPRAVVAVDAYDAGGAHLTVTQPEGAAFSSPVLLMQLRQRISGLDLPFDSFAVPAVHRIVKVVLFSPQQVALLRGIGGAPKPAVLFAVDDELDRPLPHAIRFARSGASVDVAGLRLRADVLRYPAVEILAVPSIPALAIGFLVIIAGMAIGRLRTPSRS